MAVLIKTLSGFTRLFKLPDIVKIESSFQYKLERDLHPGRTYNRIYFLCLEVDGPITGVISYKSGGYKRKFTILSTITIV